MVQSLFSLLLGEKNPTRNTKFLNKFVKNMTWGSRTNLALECPSAAAHLFLFPGSSEKHTQWIPWNTEHEDHHFLLTWPESWCFWYWLAFLFLDLMLLFSNQKRSAVGHQGFTQYITFPEQGMPPLNHFERLCQKTLSVVDALMMWQIHTSY